MTDPFDLADQSDLPQWLREQLKANATSEHYMTDAEKLSARRLRAKGWTFQAIADRLGYSKQAVHQLLTKGVA